MDPAEVAEDADACSSIGLFSSLFPLTSLWSLIQDAFEFADSFRETWSRVKRSGYTILYNIF